jgi:CyaY protein
MTDPEFMDRAEKLLAGIEASCDRINDQTDADIDNQRVGGMITLTFRNHSQIVINLVDGYQGPWRVFCQPVTLCQRAVGAVAGVRGLISS